MSDIYKELEEWKEKHEKEKHEENREEYQIDPSCLKSVLTATSYNRNTIEKLLEYIVLTRKDKDENYVLNRKKRVKEYEKIREKGEKLLNAIMLSIRHGNKPDYSKKEIISVIKLICEHYIFDEENNIIINEEETEEEVLGNKELLKYGYIIEDNELDKRFMEFEEWLKEGIATIAGIKYNMMACFKEILHMEESIANEENRNIIRKFQKNMIIRKIVKEKGFTKENSDVDKLGSSENENEMKKEKERTILKDIDNNNKEKAIGIAEKWVEKGHINVTIGGIMRLLKLGFDKLKLENDKKLIEKYEEYKDLLDDELIIKLNEINNKEDNNEITETEERLRRIKELVEYLEIEVNEGELLMLIRMGYMDGNITNKDFIENFK
ncbi:hypothetical protein C1646_743396 [Rhizophagus diaphanus]|nr:hypothetical protein C1646_743396 [Rhizophagus diaphanus] [Rhizophagus sp. MUCL 43196]